MSEIAVYLGPGSYVYLIREAYWNDPSAIGDGTTKKHIPLNPMRGFRPPKPKNRDRVEYWFSSLEPALIFTERIEPGEEDLEMLFVDPLPFLLPLFTHKTVTATWTGTGDVIMGDFTANDHIDSIALHYLVKDRSSTSELEKTLKGGKILRYEWIIRDGAKMMERVRVRCASVADETQAPDIDNGFDDGAFDRDGIDGGFSSWDTLMAKGVHASDVALTWGESPLAGLSIVNMRLTIDVNKIYQHLKSSREAAIQWEDIRFWQLEVDGFLKTTAHIVEVEKLFKDRSSQTLKLEYVTNKYLQFTNAYFSDDYDIIAIPEPGRAAACRFTLKCGPGTALSFSWTGDVATDPSNHITHT